MIAEKPQFKPGYKPQNKNLTQGENLSFLCKATGDPEPKVLWLKNGVPVQCKLDI